MQLATRGTLASIALIGVASSVAAPPDPAERPAGQKGTQSARQPLEPPAGARRLAPGSDAWIVPARRQVILDGVVCLREGPLEMFACTRGTKEHESVVSIRVKAYVVHAALLALGAEPGHPAQFAPTYRPASGTSVEIMVEWIDSAGKRRRVAAQQWIRNARSGEAMSHGWVFAGSNFWTDEQTGKRYYQAEGGDFICVSNFPSAMLDLPIKSSQANDALLFDAFTEQIPPLGTPVRLILTPKLPPRKQDTADQGRQSSPAASPAEKPASTRK